MTPCPGLALGAEDDNARYQHSGSQSHPGCSRGYTALWTLLTGVLSTCTRGDSAFLGQTCCAYCLHAILLTRVQTGMDQALQAGSACCFSKAEHRRLCWQEYLSNPAEAKLVYQALLHRASAEPIR